MRIVIDDNFDNDTEEVIFDHGNHTLFITPPKKIKATDLLKIIKIVIDKLIK